MCSLVQAAGFSSSDCWRATVGGFSGGGGRGAEGAERGANQRRALLMPHNKTRSVSEYRSKQLRTPEQPAERPTSQPADPTSVWTFSFDGIIIIQSFSATMRLMQNMITISEAPSSTSGTPGCTSQGPHRVIKIAVIGASGVGKTGRMVFPLFPITHDQD